MSEAELNSMQARAQFVAQSGGIRHALASGGWPQRLEVTLAEALVLGLLKQGVRKYLAIFGHGSTQIAEVLRVYDAAGVTRTYNFRHETAMAHAATALRWQYGELCAVVTSIGPGALQAFAGSLAAASNGVGVYHVYGDETTHGEGYNMQQIPKRIPGLYGQLGALMGRSYVLHTPEALREALRQGATTVNHPYKAGPFFLLAPINTQPQCVLLNLAVLPERPVFAPSVTAEDKSFAEASSLIGGFDRIVIKAGGGSRAFAGAVRRLAERIGAAVVLSPGSTGVLPDAHPQNMHVGGSKGSLSGNFAMANADLLIAIGTRAVCQADCSGIGYPQVRAVINLNGDFDDVMHYNNTHALYGDIGASIEHLLAALPNGPLPPAKGAWLRQCFDQKRAWSTFKTDLVNAPPRWDPVWQGEVLTQPVAIKIVADFAKTINAVKIFDAGDVQAHGFQIIEDDAPFETFTESGASYMGFAISATLASALADAPRYPIAFSGDGSFMMNPQVLIDAVQHQLRGMIVIFDNRRMGAISGLQRAQYQADFATSDSVEVDYVALAHAVKGVRALSGGGDAVALLKALHEGYSYEGISIIHVKSYWGDERVGSIPAYGKWNVGNWCEEVQRRYHEQGL